MRDEKKVPHIVVIGGGFTGLSAALRLAGAGLKVTVLERAKGVGGLADTFDFGGHTLEKFYHHFFTSDLYIMEMIRKLGLEENVKLRPTRTGTYSDGRFYRLSTPLDLLKFSPLNFLDRIRLGLIVVQARKVTDWRELEPLSVKEWLVKLSGNKVYEVVWEPLMTGKFGPYADEISAVWFWKKIVLRGGSRSRSGAEMLAYYKGGFSRLAEAMAGEVVRLGGVIRTGVTAKGVTVNSGAVTGVETTDGYIPADLVIATPAFPIIADILESCASPEFLAKLRRVHYLANLCLVLKLDRALSDIYWLNVNDPGFPFIGVIEHTNFEPADSYGGNHIVYLSKYLPKDAEMYKMPSQAIYKLALPHLKRMFPAFSEEWVKGYAVWRTDYAQHIAEKNYSRILPGNETPLRNLLISTMAQIYPEDRGMNYAIREGTSLAGKVIDQLQP